jgi:hypothetical protein
MRPPFKLHPFQILALCSGLVLTLPAYAQSSGIAAIIFSSRETTFFVSAIAALTVYFGHIKFTRFSLAHGPEILTTAGIMGCFLGIALALIDFDPKNVQQSVPLLLQGVKTAFWSSLAGVAGALYLRFLHHVRKPPVTTNPDQIKAASLDDVVSTMVALRQGLVGDEQGTLLTQMKLQRQESKDKLDELIGEFKHFAKHMVENNQKAIIEALQQVIADFNKNLTEQFGENFKQLNAAVEKLVIWQQQYKDELESIKLAQQQAASDMNKAAERFGDFINKAEQFANISEALREQLNLSQQHQATIFQQEKALADVLATMKDVTPSFATKVDAMLKEISSGLRQVESEMTALTKNLGVQIQSSNAELKHLLTDVMSQSQKEVGEALKTHVSTIKEGVLTLDKALQKELNDSLQSLGRQLASLSNKFVEDYTPLTDRLREVVQMSGRIRE